MRSFLTTIVLLVSLMLSTDCLADGQATQFFAIESTELAKIAPTDADVDSLSSNKLAEICIAQGVYSGGMSMQFMSSTFRIDARFGGRADIRGDAESITYHIDASSDKTSWNLLSEQGVAIKQGKQYITDGWRKRKIVVILRYLGLKH